MENFTEWCENGTGTFYIKGQEKNPTGIWYRKDKTPNWYAYDVAATHKIEIVNPYLFTVPSKEDGVQPMRVPVSELQENEILALARRELKRYVDSCQSFNRNRNAVYANPNGMWGYRGMTGLAASLTETGRKLSETTLAKIRQMADVKDRLAANIRYPLSEEAQHDGACIFNSLNLMTRLGKITEPNREM